MDQARSTISKIFNGEPHSYTRFNLTQNMEGDTSQVEMKLSSDMDEEVGGNGVGEHLNHNSNRKPYVSTKLGRTPKNLLFMIGAPILIFIIGYLISYLIHGKKDVAPVCSASKLSAESAVPPETGAAPLMDWKVVKDLLAEQISAANFEPVFSEFSSQSHRAGSSGDEALGEKVRKKFRDYGMKTWTDEHFVKVQDLPAPTMNSLSFKNGTPESVDGFLSYSRTGKTSGAVLYGHYGQMTDFKQLQNKGILLNGRVMLMRSGGISIAEKVANAAKMKASAVLIYPDPSTYSVLDNPTLFGHVHFGTGDPYTPGFPSFNHTQFPPAESSGLPNIFAQTITAAMAQKILSQLGGETAPEGWGNAYKLGGESDVVTLEVNNVLVQRKITNIFGVIKGFVDPDRYVVIGAQRDAWGQGFATATVGTSVLVELARSIADMVEHTDFKPRRSIVFASWSAGEYGSVGATEWLEGYLTSLNMKAFAYIDLDGVVTGQEGFKAAASPLMYDLIKSTMEEVTFPKTGSTLYARYVSSTKWESTVMEPLSMSTTAYPFIAFSGIPSVSFRFNSNTQIYPYFGTMLDTRERLNTATSNRVAELTEAAARFAAHIALRLVHDHLLRFDLRKYERIIRSNVAQINNRVLAVQRTQPQLLPKDLTTDWLTSASGSYSRAAQEVVEYIKNSDLDDIEMCRLINDRIMAVERNFLSPYMSPKDVPFRHILLDSGPHTLKGLSNHLEDLKADQPEADANLFRNQFALATWTIQGCANSLAGDIWSLDNEV